MKLAQEKMLTQITKLEKENRKLKSVQVVEYSGGVPLSARNTSPMRFTSTNASSKKIESA